MTTDNRTNEQIVAEAITAYWQDEERSGPNRGPVAHDAECGKAAVADLEAAGRLVAAEGAAPQAETDRALEIAHELAKVHTFTMADGEAIARAALSLAVRALPSSGVDEDKLAKVIDKALIRHGEMAGMSNQERWDARDDIARAVAEWLKEQGLGHHVISLKAL